MKIEEQVTNLELSQKLKELRVKQDSYFKYEVREHGNVEIYHSKATSCAHKYYSAFTSAELGELLPKELNSNDKYAPYHINIKWELHYSGDFMWHVTYISYTQGINDFIIYDLNINNALAKMLIYLIENNLWKPA